MHSNKVTLVSVVIINYNSKDFLRQCLANAVELDWPDLEVIVVDNASSDGSPEMVETDFGKRVRLIRREHNSPTAARNQGFHAARGEYLLSLDSDMTFDRTMIRKAVCLFAKFPRVAVLAFKVGPVDNPEEPLPEHWWHPVPLQAGKDRFFSTDYFSEGAVFFRKNALMALGGYDETLVQYYEGNDLSFRFLAEGYDMLYCPTLFCGELKVPGYLHRNLKNTRLHYLRVRNRIWMVWKHYSLWRGLPFLLIRTAIAGYRSVRNGWIGTFLKGVKDGVFAPKAIRVQRRPLSKEVWKKARQMRGGIFWEVEEAEVAGGALRGNEELPHSSASS